MHYILRAEEEKGLSAIRHSTPSGAKKQTDKERCEE